MTLHFRIKRISFFTELCRFLVSDAIIGDEKVKFRVREKKRMSDIKDRFGFHQYEQTGEFVFVIDIGPYRRKEIKDGYEPVEKTVPIFPIFAIPIFHKYI